MYLCMLPRDTVYIPKGGDVYLKKKSFQKQKLYIILVCCWSSSLFLNFVVSLFCYVVSFDFYFNIYLILYKQTNIN